MSLLSRLLRKPIPDPEDAGPLYPAVKAAMVDVQAYARSHGGEIHLVNVTVDGEVQVRLSGACQGCPLSDITLKKGIELNLKRMVPGVQKVVQVR